MHNATRNNHELLNTCGMPVVHGPRLTSLPRSRNGVNLTFGRSTGCVVLGRSTHAVHEVMPFEERNRT